MARPLLPLLAAAALTGCAATPPAGAPQGSGWVAAPADATEADALAQIESPGTRHGLATFDYSPHGVLIGLHVSHLPPGMHGVHLHAKGDCSDSGKAAGPHVHTGAAGAHGLLNPAGPEAGDLPNLVVGPDGRAEAQFFTPYVRLGGASQHPNLLDADGSAIVIHAGPDDQVTQPIGGSGDRIACGVIRRP